MTSEERHELRYQRRQEKRLQKKREVTADFDDFDKVFTYDNLYRAYRACRRNVRWKASTQKYISNAPLILYETFKKLHSGRFKSDGFYEFDIFERGKARHIRSVTMTERVVQRCLCDYSLVPMLTRTFIYDNGASMAGKGYTFAVNRMLTHLRRFYRKHGCAGYVLLFDFSSYFDNIPHELIFRIVEREYTDERLIHIIKHFVSMFGERGLGLGSQISQIFALAAGNELDHYIKEKLGIHYYGRYMDDGYLIHPNKEYLQHCLEELKKICDRLGFTLNLKKTMLIPLKKGFRWLKVNARLTETGYIVRKVWKKSTARERQRLKKMTFHVKVGRMNGNDLWQSFQSWDSHIMRYDSYETRLSMYKLYRKLCEDAGVEPKDSKRHRVFEKEYLREIQEENEKNQNVVA